MTGKCKVCGQDIKIMVFRGEEWCCDNHRKIVQGEAA